MLILKIRYPSYHEIRPNQEALAQISNAFSQYGGAKKKKKQV